MIFLTNLINGLSLGSVYAIIALGYTMVYGISKMLNFAHGDVIMVGAYISFCATSYLNLPAWVSVILAMIVCTALGILIEGLAYRPLRGTGSLAVLITAIGVSYFLQNAALIIWGSAPKVFTSVFSGFGSSISLFGGELTVTWEALFTLVAAIIIMIGMTLFTGRTKVGKAMRAVSEDNGAAQLMGINSTKVIQITFIISGVLAGIAGVFLGIKYTLYPTLGSLVVKGFIASVIGGLGSLTGAVIGAVLLGILETVLLSVLGSGYSTIATFAVMLLFLLIRPQGIAGSNVQEKA